MSVLHMSVLLAIAALIMHSCTAMRSTPLVNQQSQITNQQLRIDSIYHYEKDSMAISFRPATVPSWNITLAEASPEGAKGAHEATLEQTLGGARSAGDICGTGTSCADVRTASKSFAYYSTPRDTLVIERWHTRFKDHETVKTDTLKVTEYQTITETQKYIPRFYRICTWICCVGVVLLVLLLVLKFTLKFI